MIGVAWDVIKAFVKALFGLGGSKGPSAVQLSADGAKASAELKQEQSANAEIGQAATARAGADVAVVRSLAEGGPAVDASANANLEREFPGEFR